MGLIPRLETASVGEIAAADPRAAGLFERLGVDFYCGGRQPIAEACRQAGLDPALVIRELTAFFAAADTGDDTGQWPLDRLIDHIVSQHHAYVRQALPAIAAQLTKLDSTHAKQHPELAHVGKIFEKLSTDLRWHLRKEEHVLFPYLRDLVKQSPKADSALVSPFGTVQNPIRMMEREHQDVVTRLGEIRELTGEFATPPEGGRNYALCMEKLSAFDRDLHRHFHLENDVLFPRAIALERGAR